MYDMLALGIQFAGAPQFHQLLQVLDDLGAAEVVCAGRLFNRLRQAEELIEVTRDINRIA